MPLAHLSTILWLADLTGGDTLIVFGCVALSAAVLIFIFGISADPADSAPHRSHLDQLLERRDAIYENLRDLRFEFRSGKFAEAGLSDDPPGARKRSRFGGGSNRAGDGKPFARCPARSCSYRKGGSMNRFLYRTNLFSAAICALTSHFNFRRQFRFGHHLYRHREKWHHEQSRAPGWM